MTDAPKSDIPAGTPEGYTEERPGPSELGEPGTPGAGLTPQVPHAADADLVEHGHAPADPAGTGHHVAGAHVAGTNVAGTNVDSHAAGAHVDSHAALPDDGHGHAEARLGPIDWVAWAYAIVGGLAGLVVLALFYVAVS
jgi:hypothetical protein